ncbi:hypothetical protein HG531_003806 [Fusarium graminearum]|nr:hypothetical protein HG531_003806 [Fusarium graminearum]
MRLVSTPSNSLLFPSTIHVNTATLEIRQHGVQRHPDQHADIPDVGEPPKDLVAKRARSILEFPLPRLLVEPQTQQTSISTEIAHHAAHRDLAAAGDALASWDLLCLGVGPVVRVATCVVVAVEHQTRTAVAFAGSIALCAHTPHALQETTSSINAELVLLLETSAIGRGVKVKERSSNDAVDETVRSILKRKRLGWCIEVHIVDTDDAQLRNHPCRIGVFIRVQSSPRLRIRNGQLKTKLVVCLSKNPFKALQSLLGQVSSISNIVVSCHIHHSLLPNLLFLATIQNSRYCVIDTWVFRQVVRKPLGSFKHAVPEPSASLLEFLVVDPLATDEVAQH